MNDLDTNSLLVGKGITKLFIKQGSKPIEVLKNLDIDIYQGDSIAIIGKSGAGKSTLLHILGTLEAPTRGTVYFQGENVYTFDEQKLSLFRNRQLGFVFQFHYLMNEFTALENVMMPGLIAGLSHKNTTDRARFLLGRVGLEKRLTHRPNELSGGEQQRVAIARALLMNPKCLLTDEMTGNLDPNTGYQVFELVQSIHAEFKMALVSVTHDETLAKSYSVRYRLVDGLLRREG